MNAYCLYLSSKQSINKFLIIVFKLDMDKRTFFSCNYKSHGRLPLQVSITSSAILNGVHPTRYIDTLENECRCIRCGDSMEKCKSVFVNIQPPVFEPQKNCSSMSMEILSKRSGSNASLDSDTRTSCAEYCLLKSLNIFNSSESEACSLDLECSSQDESNTTISRFLNSDSSEEEERTSIEMGVIRSQQNFTPNNHVLQPIVPNIYFKEDLVSHPCTDCHVAVLNEASERQESEQEFISLMLQVAHLSPPRKSVECQTDGSAYRSDIGVEVNILEIYPKINTKCGSSEGKALSGSTQDPQQNLPELDAEAEAAYRCHLKNLVPCSHCGRTFNPDRVMVHENACIEKPRKKKRKGRK